MRGFPAYSFNFPLHPCKVMFIRHLQQQIFGAGIAIDVANPISY